MASVTSLPLCAHLHISTPRALCFVIFLRDLDYQVVCTSLFLHCSAKKNDGSKKGQVKPTESSRCVTYYRFRNDTCSCRITKFAWWHSDWLNEEICIDSRAGYVEMLLLTLPVYGMSCSGSDFCFFYGLMPRL